MLLVLPSSPAGATRRADPHWTILDATQVTSEGEAVFERLSDGSYLVSGPAADKDV